MKDCCDESGTASLRVAPKVPALLCDWVLWLTLFLALAIRLDFLVASNWVIDSDEGIVGLMAKHTLEGNPLPTFYYGQHYMGALEAYLASLSFQLIGITPFALKLVPLIFSIALIPLFYLLGAALGGKVAARSSALFAALPPSALVLWSGMARGGFIEVVWLGALAMWLTILWLQKERPSYLLITTIGLVLGLGWWTNNQIVFFFVPIGIAILFRYVQLVLYRTPCKYSISASFFISFFSGLAAFILGSLPFWKYNLTHNWATFEMFQGAKSLDLAKHIEGYFSHALPILFGGKRFWQDSDSFPAGTLLVYVLIIGIAAIVVWQRRRQLLQLLRGTLDVARPVELFVILFVATSAIFITSRFGFLYTAPRYLLPLYVAIFPLMGFALSTLPTKLGSIVLMVLLAINLSSSYVGGRAVAGQPFVFGGERAAKDHAELITWLAKENYHLVRTNYWIGYRLSFETKEAVRFVMFREPYQIRIEAYEALAADSEQKRIPFVLVPSQAAYVREGLTALGFSFRENLISEYVVIDKIVPLPGTHAWFGAAIPPPNLVALSPALLSAQSTIHTEAAREAIDDNLTSRWGSAAPQTPHMQFTITLQTPQIVTGLWYELGAFKSDFPRGLQIERELPDGTSEMILTPAQYDAIRYTLNDPSVFFFPVPATPTKAIRLQQTGADPVFDWSIAELKLLREKK
jgi:hypothetical protein